MDCRDNAQFGSSRFWVECPRPSSKKRHEESQRPLPARTGVSTRNRCSFRSATAGVRRRALSCGARCCGHDQTLRTHRSEEHTSELQSLIRIPYAVFRLKKKKTTTNTQER